MKYHTNECRKRFLENEIQTINILRSEKWEEEKLTKWKGKKKHIHSAKSVWRRYDSWINFNKIYNSDDLLFFK